MRKKGVKYSGKIWKNEIWKIYITMSIMLFLQYKDHRKVENSGINKEWHEMNQQCSLSVITSIFPYYKYDRRVLFDKYFSMKIATERISKPRKMNRKEINILRQRISKHVTLSTLHMLLIFKVQLRYVLYVTEEYYVEMSNSCLESILYNV